MRVLITGASGLLGTSLAPLLTATGHEVVRHSYRSTGDVACDLTDYNTTRAMIDAVRPQVVVNLVACTDVDKCERDLHEAYLLNIRPVENLVASMRNVPEAFLIQISTDQVYDTVGPNREEDVRLTNAYALTKYAGELAGLLMSCAVLRTNFFGHSRAPNRMSFSDWALDNLRAGKPITAFTDIMINPLSIPTLCRMIAHVMERRAVGVFNLGSHDVMSKADFIFEIARVYGLSTAAVKRGVSADAGLSAYRPKDMSMDCQRFEAAFDVTLPHLKDEIASLNGSDNAIVQ